MVKLLLIGAASAISFIVAALVFFSVLDVDERMVVAVQWLVFGLISGIIFVYFGGFSLLRSRSETAGDEASDSAEADEQAEATDGVFGVPRVGAAADSTTESATAHATVGRTSTPPVSAAGIFGRDAVVDQPETLEAALFVDETDFDEALDDSEPEPPVSLFGRSTDTHDTVADDTVVDELEDEVTDEVEELEDEAEELEAELADDESDLEVDELVAAEAALDDVDEADLEAEDELEDELAEELVFDHDDDLVDDELHDQIIEINEVDAEVEADAEPSTELAPLDESSSTVVFPVSDPTTGVTVRRYTSNEVMATVKKQEQHLVETLIHEGLLTTEGPITDRDVRTMVFVAVSSKELVEVLTGDLNDGESVEITAPAPAELESESPAELTE